jgi:hypothetical protein
MGAFINVAEVVPHSGLLIECSTVRRRLRLDVLQVNHETFCQGARAVTPF